MHTHTLHTMARIDRFTANFPLNLLMLLLGLVARDVFASDPQSGYSGILEIQRKQQLCNFNEDTRTYNATDLLLCLNELAINLLQQQNSNPNRISDRSYQDIRQSYPSYQYAPDYSIPSNGDGISNNYGIEQLSSLLSGGGLSSLIPGGQLPSLLSGGGLPSLLSGETVPLTSLGNLINFNGLSRPNFDLFGALSSIAQFDDYKCVPRILCEVASGSNPGGNLAYRQSSGFQDLGKNALFRLLTAFDTSGTSPILSFGKAALLGYTNRGQPNTCYQEYSRCPRDPNQLISYLNNHNGGFFRFFNGNRGQYYRPPYSSYQPYYKKADNLQYRIVQLKPQNEGIQSLLGPEADRTGTGKLFFKYADGYDQYDNNNNNNFFFTKIRESDSSRIQFPKENQEDHNLQSNRIMKSLNVFNYLNGNSIKKEPPSYYKQPTFFPQEDEDQNNNIGYFSQTDYHQKPRTEVFGNKNSYVHFPHDR